MYRHKTSESKLTYTRLYNRDILQKEMKSPKTTILGRGENLKIHSSNYGFNFIEQKTHQKHPIKDTKMPIRIMNTNLENYKKEESLNFRNKKEGRFQEMNWKDIQPRTDLTHNRFQRNSKESVRKASEHLFRESQPNIFYFY